MSQEDVNSIILSPRQVATGDPVGNALENINTNVLGDGALCYVESGAGQGQWQLQKEATNIPDGTTIVAPTAGPGRWFLKLSPGTSPGGATFEVLRDVEFEIVDELVAGGAVSLTAEWPSVDPDDLVCIAARVSGLTPVAPIAATAGEGSVAVLFLAYGDVSPGSFVLLSLYRYRAPV